MTLWPILVIRLTLVSGDGNNVLAIGAATRNELVRLRREALDAMALKMKADPPNGAFASPAPAEGRLSDIAR